MAASSDGAGLTIFVGPRGRELTAEHRAQIDAAAPDADVRHFERRGDMEQEIEQADVVIGSISADGLARAKRLRWIQSWAAGPNEVLFPEMVDSPILARPVPETAASRLPSTPSC
jgi:phosphoglycerate dehydrogenase-like enzyme